MMNPGVTLRELGRSPIMSDAEVERLPVLCQDITRNRRERETIVREPVVYLETVRRLDRDCRTMAAAADKIWGNKAASTDGPKAR